MILLHNDDTTIESKGQELQGVAGRQSVDWSYMMSHNSHFHQPHKPTHMQPKVTKASE